MQELAAKGFDTNKIIGAMPGIIKAAEASGEELALTSDVVTSALNAFNMEAEQASHIADVMAMAANQTAAGINDMGYAFKYAAPVANSLGIDMEELAAATGLMVDKGLEGSQAGTSLRMGLMRLTDAPKEAAKAMDAMGFSAVDASGNFKSIKQITDELRQSMDGMTQAQKVQTLGTIFGTEAATGWLGLIDSAPGKLDKLTNSLKNSKGAATETANKMMDNAKGAIEQMMGAFESVQIAVMTPVLPMVKKIATEIGNFASNIKPEQFEEFGNSISNGLGKAYETVKTFAKFVYDNWTTISNVVLAAGTAFVTFKTLVMGITAVQAVVQVIGLLRGIITGVTAVQWGWNAALLANPLTWIVAGIAALVAIGIVLWRNWDLIKAKTTELWTHMVTKFTEIKNAVVEKVTSAVNAAVTFISQLPSKAAYWLGYLVATASTKLSALPGNFKKWFSNASKSATDIVSKLPGKIAEWLAKIPGKAAGIIKSVTAKFKELGAAIPKAIAQGFDSAMGALGRGAKWAMDKLIGGVTNLASLGRSMADSFNQGVKDGGGVKVDGSAYFGESYVPRNGMLYKLHKGERVLTAAENKEYSGGGGSSSNIYLTVTYNGGAATEQEFEKFAAFLNKRLGQAMTGGA